VTRLCEIWKGGSWYVLAGSASQEWNALSSRIHSRKHAPIHSTVTDPELALSAGRTLILRLDSSDASFQRRSCGSARETESTDPSVAGFSVRKLESILLQGSVVVSCQRGALLQMSGGPRGRLSKLVTKQELLLKIRERRGRPHGYSNPQSRSLVARTPKASKHISQKKGSSYLEQGQNADGGDCAVSYL
jgi:hypothetical protein